MNITFGRAVIWLVTLAVAAIGFLFLYSSLTGTTVFAQRDGMLFVGFMVLALLVHEIGGEGLNEWRR